MKKSILLTFLTISSLSFAVAQETIKGIIKDETGEPLPGATVFVKGTTTSSVADVNGEFNIKGSNEFPFTLVVNSVGYKTQDIEIYEL